MTPLRVQVENLERKHQKASKVIEVLRGVNVTFEPGERVAILGPSGSGKSTFLHQIGLLDRPNGGTVLLDGQDTAAMSERQRAEFRSRRIGFVFQAHHLLPEHTALGNVALPVQLAGGSQHASQQRAQALLEAVGLADRMHHRPGELSGGEQQRVALARALVMGPGLVLADEPTGNLDPETAAGVFDLMLRLNVQLKSTLLVVTHSEALAKQFPRRLYLEHGTLGER